MDDMVTPDNKDMKNQYFLDTIGRGIEPIPACNEDDDGMALLDLGYDSDPAEFSFRQEEEEQVNNNNSSSSPQEPQQDASFNEEQSKKDIEESLNTITTLLWHPSSSTTSRNISTVGSWNDNYNDDDDGDYCADDFSFLTPCSQNSVHDNDDDNDTKKKKNKKQHYKKKHSKKPTMVHCWIERGTFCHGGDLVVEPHLMWRQVYQADLVQNKRLNPSSKKPYGVRLLNICRIVELDPHDLPFGYVGRPSCGFCIKTTSGGRNFIFEAPSKLQRDKIMQQWKHSVARLASLAVLEEFGTMSDEFFSPLMLSPAAVHVLR